MKGNLEHGFLQKETWIPVSLALYAEKENLIEELKFYIGLKLICSGKIKADNKRFKALKLFLGIGSKTTVIKRLNALKKFNWIGFNPKSGCYFIRGYKRVCSDLNIPSKTCVEFDSENFKDFRAYVFAAVVGQRIKAMEYAKKRSKEKDEFVPQYWLSGTNPDSPSHLLNLEYNGLSNSAMGKLTGKSLSRCSELKNLAEKSGFLWTKEKLLVVDIVPRNPEIREILSEDYPLVYPRFKIRPIKSGKNKGKLKILEQSFDEIIPLLRYRNRRE